MFLFSGFLTCALRAQVNTTLNLLVAAPAK